MARGPLLAILHFTDIEELTNFSVYEGEMVMIDPKRDNRVLKRFGINPSRIRQQ